jgi:tetratricopeptide (TPR) repeat protein
MRQWLIVFFVIISVTDALSQKKGLDSLLKIIATTSNDTVRIKASYELGRKLHTNDPDTALTIFQSVLKLIDQSRQNENWKLVNSTNVLQAMGNTYQQKDDYQTAAKYYQKALSNFHKMGAEDGIATIYLNLGNNWSFQGDFKTGQEYFFKALAIQERIHDEHYMMITTNAIGNSYFYQGDYPRALQFYLKALKMAEATGSDDVALYMGNVAIVYIESGELDKALDYTLKAIEKDQKLGNEQDVGRHYGNIGVVYSLKKDYRQALEYHRKSLGFMIRFNNPSEAATQMGNMGIAYHYLGNNDSALKYHTEALRLDNQIGNFDGISRHTGNIGVVKLSQGKMDEAERYLTEAVRLSEKNGDPDGLKDWHSQLSELYEKMGKWGLSLEHYKKHILYRDSLFNESNTKKQVQAEMNFEFERKEAEAKLEQEKKEAITSAENKKQKIIIWSVTGILVLVLLFALFAYRSFLQKKKANAEIGLQKQIIEEKQKEILDSIHYARRIQNALITSERYIKNTLGRLKN